MRRKFGRVNFRKNFWDWPIADQRVPSNYPRDICGTRFGSSSLLFSKVAKVRATYFTNWLRNKGVTKYQTLVFICGPWQLYSVSVSFFEKLFSTKLIPSVDKQSIKKGCLKTALSDLALKKKKAHLTNRPGGTVDSWNLVRVSGFAVKPWGKWGWVARTSSSIPFKISLKLSFQKTVPY